MESNNLEKYCDILQGCNENESRFNSESFESDDNVMIDCGESSNRYSDETAENVPLTPFNMNEELSEGYFDSSGTYHWNKKRAVADNWLDSLDEFCHKPRGHVKCNETFSTNSSDTFDLIETYKKILTYLEPNETIGHALCRLGGKHRLTTIERLKCKQTRRSSGDTVNKQKICDLTELANSVLNKCGGFDIYHETYEEILKKVHPNKCPVEVNETSLSIMKNNTKLDMYCDDFEEKEKEFLKGK